MTWIQVLHDDDGHRKIDWKRREDPAQSLHATGRGCDGHDARCLARRDLALSPRLSYP